MVANDEIINAFSNANTVVSLANGNLGPSLVKELFKSGEILSLSNDRVKPFYKDRAHQALNWFREALVGVPYRIHQPEGAIFLWLWFEGLPITSQELYERLKRRGVLVVPGHNFFVGMDSEWRHQRECIRISYAQDSESVEKGIALVGEEVRRAFREK